jgi:hypothetical protein
MEAKYRDGKTTTAEEVAGTSWNIYLLIPFD